MARDYHSADFNAYNSGMGALMQPSGSSAGRLGGGRGEGSLGGGDGVKGDNISLFVSNIPVALTKVSYLVGSKFSPCLNYGPVRSTISLQEILKCLFFTCRTGFEISSLELVWSRRFTLSSPSSQTRPPPMGGCSV